MLLCSLHSQINLLTQIHNKLWHHIIYIKNIYASRFQVFIYASIKTLSLVPYIYYIYIGVTISSVLLCKHKPTFSRSLYITISCWQVSLRAVCRQLPIILTYIKIVSHLHNKIKMFKFFLQNCREEHIILRKYKRGKRL